MRWNKRLKILRISKAVIPIALAVSLIFAGFSVFARKAENYVVRTNGDSDVKLALSFNRDLSEQSSVLYAPASGEYNNMGFVPDKNLLYNPDAFLYNIPDDIAKYDGMHSGYNYSGQVSFYSFSFYLINNSKRAVDVDVIMNLDGVIYSEENRTSFHVDDAIKVMWIEDEPLLSDETYLVYTKKEQDTVIYDEESGETKVQTTAEEKEQHLLSHIQYGKSLVPFYDSTCVFKRMGQNGYTMGMGEVKKFTLCLWLEGWDMDCTDPIYKEQIKMSLDFVGY